MPLRPRALSVGALLVCGACSSFGPPPPELIRSLDAVDPPRAERALASVTIESEDFSGTFQCALARRRAPAPAVRMKLYSDLGGAVIDLVATTERVTGRFAQTGIGIDWNCGRGEWILM
jgi:hypothetical protein